MTPITTRLLTAGLIASVAAGGAVAAGAQTIKIGDINSYSRLPGHTVPYRRGAVLAIEQINKAGGVLGKKLELVSVTTKASPARPSRSPRNCSCAKRWCSFPGRCSAMWG